ncbi:aromatic ring-hydroxylating dioxygenase subunit alpha [Candidatus Woesebacteria bacterium]|nr:aromatic ring-hydroxylating dioxygenase subunit alpha [Candidatus Woesebacteria bacterium]
MVKKNSTSFKKTSSTYKQGSQTLPGSYYNSSEIFDRENKKIFSKSWHCVGRLDRVEKSGDFFLATIAGESLIIVKDNQGKLHAFFNVCRHRGTRICEALSGNTGGAIQCPYHAWTYKTDGKLVAAPHMNEAKKFKMSDYPLHEASVATWEGFIFVSIAKKPVAFETAWKPMINRLKRFGIENLKVGHKVSYDIEANWKLVFQNYNECLHCPTIHPKLSAVLPYTSGANDLTSGPFLGGYMLIRSPNKSATMSGNYCARLVSDKLSDEETKRAYYYTFMPNMFLSIQPDYVNYYMIHPLSATKTRIESEWLFHPETLAKKKNKIKDAIDFWDMTNRQDWDIVEQSAAGIASSRYTPGQYSPRETIPAAWDREYLKQLK